MPAPFFSRPLEGLRVKTVVNLLSSIRRSCRTNFCLHTCPAVPSCIFDFLCVSIVFHRRTNDGLSHTRLQHQAIIQTSSSRMLPLVKRNKPIHTTESLTCIYTAGTSLSMSNISCCSCFFSKTRPSGYVSEVDLYAAPTMCHGRIRETRRCYPTSHSRVHHAS